MSSIPLPALHAQAPQVDATEPLQKAMALRNMAMQQQLQQQQLQHNQIQNQLQTQQLRDQQTVMQAMAQNPDPKQFLPSLRGKVSPQTYMALVHNDAQTREQLAKADQAELALQKDKNDRLVGLVSQAQALPPEQYAQQWPAILQQVESIHPGTAQRYQLDPNNPVPQEKLGVFKLGLQTSEQYIKQEQDRRAAAEHAAKMPGMQAESAIKAAEAEMLKQGGMTQQMADSRYRMLQQRIAAGTPLNPDEQNFVKAYEKQKLLVPVASANVRIAGLQESREYPVINKQTGQLEMRNAKEINASNGQFAPAGAGGKAMGQTALIEDIRGNIQQVRANLQDPKMPEFTAAQRAQIAFSLGGKEPGTALQAAIRGGVLGSLTAEQQDYLVNLAQLTENAMAMRQVLGAGQGSEDLRDAIKATIPSPRTPTKAYGINQLAKFEAVLDRLSRGIPGMPLKPQAGAQANQPQPQQGGGFNWNSLPQVKP